MNAYEAIELLIRRRLATREMIFEILVRATPLDIDPEEFDELWEKAEKQFEDDPTLFK